MFTIHLRLCACSGAAMSLLFWAIALLVVAVFVYAWLAARVE